MQTLKNRVRKALLFRRNLARVRDFVLELPPGGPPIFILASPADLHFAPLAGSIITARFRQVFVANGLSKVDIAWLRARCPTLPILSLSASLSGNPASYLPHGELVDLLALGFDRPFFIQDADCFPLDDEVFQSLRLPRDGEYAAGPFWKDCPDWDQILPDTFLVGINPGSLSKIEKRYGVNAAIYATPPKRAAARLQSAGLPHHWLPERAHDKEYFDTLQLSWILATLDGETFGRIQGVTEYLHHVGGTSYLAAKPSLDLAHWDWWPLNTCYTTLRVLERPEWKPICGRFAHLHERFGSADKVTQDYPAFVASNRFRETESVLKALAAVEL